ncbi:MAG: glutamate 5-kinase [Nitrospiraceae bacterium]|nr:glutamate 5-kinase [Nitrospiraceae bacterium]
MSRIVVKIGSNILTKKTGGLDTKRVDQLAADISSAAAMGHEIAVVSSGAVAAGMKKLGLKTKPKEIQLKQAAAAIGQSALMWAYEKAFAEHKTKVAQVLMTSDDFSDRTRYLNSKNTLMTLLSFNVLPIINENDTVSTNEIKFGDNDQLAALVSGLIDADRLVILSDVDGLYTSDPSKDKGAKLISEVYLIDSKIELLAGGSGSAVGTGGMYSKVLAAKKAVSYGINVNIINGKKKGALVKLLKSVKTGTEFFPNKTRISSKKGWIAYAVRPKGLLILDDGAVTALLKSGKSLLPSGVRSVEGQFEQGDAVYCADSSGTRIAKGISNYSSGDILRIAGKKTSEIESALGYKYSDEIIHRDNLVVTAQQT